MQGAIAVGVVALLAVLALGAALTKTSSRWTCPDGLAAQRNRAIAGTDALVLHLGRPVTAALTVLAGLGLVAVLLWPLGRAAKLVEPAVDVPLFRWFESRQDSDWTAAWRVLTNIGSLNLTQALTVAGAIALAGLWIRRRWWVPAIILPVGYLMEKYSQELLKLVVHRGHPPTTLGTWPSGGCARVILVYGLLVFFVLRWRAPRSLTPWVAGWSLVAFAATVQAYARIYNLEHWFTDVVGGLVLGILLLLVMITAATVLDRASRERAVPTTEPRRELTPSA